MQTQTHTNPHNYHSDSQEPRDIQNVEKEPMASTAIVIVIVAALAVALVWFASAYYGTVYKNTDTEEGAASNTSTAPQAASPNVPNTNANTSPTAGGNQSNTDTNTNPNASNDNSNSTVNAPATANTAR